MQKERSSAAAGKKSPRGAPFRKDSRPWAPDSRVYVFCFLILV